MTSMASGALGGIGSMASGIIAMKGENDAYEIQKKGIDTQTKYLKKNFNPQKLAELSLKYDKGFLQRRMDMQKEFDPELAEMRELGKKQLLDQARMDPSSLQSTKTANQLFRENINEDPKSAELRARLISQATKNLDAGAELPPEFQAELLRSGLNAGNQAGIKTDKRTIGGPVARLLGGAGVQLQQQRENQAMNLASSADASAQSRAKILSNIFPAVAAVEHQNAQRAGSAFALGQETMPSAGLTGREVLGLDISQKQGIMGLIQGKSDLRAQHKLAQSRMLGNVVGSAMSFGQMSTQTDPNTGSPVPTGGGGGGGGGMGGGGGGMDMGSIMGIVGMFSDRNVKENFARVNVDDVLVKLNAVPVSAWNYVFEPGVKHVGPMAQDFNSVFGVGAGVTINPVDVFGVMLAAIKALTEKITVLEEKLSHGH
jgi:hypothetical protein